MTEPEPAYWFCTWCGNPVDSRTDDCCPEGSNEPAWEEEQP